MEDLVYQIGVPDRVPNRGYLASFFAKPTTHQRILISRYHPVESTLVTATP
jgi:hypothetical protein